MRGGNRILFEGFCEMFTEEVLREWIPKAQADSDATLRGEVEGVDGGGKPWPDFTPDMVRDYSAGDYAEYAKRAKEMPGWMPEYLLVGGFLLGALASFVRAEDWPRDVVHSQSLDGHYGILVPTFADDGPTSCNPR